MAQYMRNTLASYGLPLARTLVASYGNYIPQNMTRENMASQDSFAVAMIRAGYDGAVQGVMWLESNSSASLAYNTAGALFTPNMNFASGNPYGYSPLERTISVRATSDGKTFAPTSGATTSFGRFRWLSARENDESGNLGVAPNHVLDNEWFTAIARNPWYFPLGAYNHYSHTLTTRASVILIRPSDLGYSLNTSSNQSRQGYTMLRRVVNRVRAINAMKWQGSAPAIVFSHADDVTP